MPDKNELIKKAIQYSIDVAKWVKDVNQWVSEQPETQTESDEGPGSNPPPPPPPPPSVFDEP